MPARNEDLHGNAPDQADTVMILIDVISDLEFDGGDELLEPALAAAERIAALKRRARRAGIPVVYANDNFGRWRSDFREVVERCSREGVRGKEIVEKLIPDPADYFVLKPKHSAFFSTTLALLLEYFGATRLILTGFTGDICVLFTAQDAHMRDFHLQVPEDCVASRRADENEQALAYMRRVLGADTRASADIALEEGSG